MKSNTTFKNSPFGVRNPRADEIQLVETLKSNGIFAVIGSLTHFKWVDVVAWGCIPIELKTATYNHLVGGFHFRLQTRHDRGIQGDIIVLSCIGDKRQSYHVFPSDSPVFYRNGILKKAVSYRPNASRRRPEIATDVLTSELMEEHENSWNYIEFRRLELVRELMQ